MLALRLRFAQSHIDETRRPGESAQAMVARLAEAKARAVSQTLPREKDCIVIGADTAVEMNGEIFGKPRDAREPEKCSLPSAGALTRFFRVFSCCDCRTAPRARLWKPRP